MTFELNEQQIIDQIVENVVSDVSRRLVDAITCGVGRLKQELFAAIEHSIGEVVSENLDELKDRIVDVSAKTLVPNDDAFLKRIVQAWIAEIDD